MIESVVRRAKQLALKRFLQTGVKGIKREEFKENENLPGSTSSRRASLSQLVEQPALAMRRRKGASERRRWPRVLARGHGHTGQGESA
jgi:hypothetical protein